MICRYFVVSLIVAGCSAELYDGSGIIDSLLGEVNDYVATNKLNEIKLPRVETNGWLLKKIFMAGVLKDFATVTRVGEATIIPNRSGDHLNYVVQSKVGLDSLEAQSDYTIQTLFGLVHFTGQLDVKAKTNVIDLEATIVVNTKSQSCEVVVNDLAVIKLGDFDVKVSHGWFLKAIVETAVQWAIRYIVPKAREEINLELHEFIRTYPVNPQITANICKYFLPK